MTESVSLVGELDPEGAYAAQIAAAMALGRLDGAVRASGAPTLRVFAARLLRDMLASALRQEGHAFTDIRFHAWFAGLVTLSDEPPRLARPPRALAEAMLTELTHSSWEPLATLATRLLPALLAPTDYVVSDRANEQGHETAIAILASAQDLIDRSQTGSAISPISALLQLHRAIRQDVTFAPAERSIVPVISSSWRRTSGHIALPSPRWAIELLWGEHWKAAGILHLALPWPGLVQLDALHSDLDAHDAPRLLASTLHHRAQHLTGVLTEADQTARFAITRAPGGRATSRAPALYELLAGFGPLRASQIEMLLGATRLGVRAILGALDATGKLERSTIAGVRLYAAPQASLATQEAVQPASRPAFSAVALADYDASMAHIEQLLSRRGRPFEGVSD